MDLRSKHVKFDFFTDADGWNLWFNDDTVLFSKFGVYLFLSIFWPTLLNWWMSILQDSSEDSVMA